MRIIDCAMIVKNQTCWGQLQRDCAMGEHSGQERERRSPPHAHDKKPRGPPELGPVCVGYGERVVHWLHAARRRERGEARGLNRRDPMRKRFE